MANGRQSGKIARIVEDRGFGFIRGTSGDLFFHMSAVVSPSFNELNVGDAVEFEVTDFGKGPRAERVERIVG